jgi:hypothetical protein
MVTFEMIKEKNIFIFILSEMLRITITKVNRYQGEKFYLFSQKNAK